jgi:hypothetical protein
MDHSVCATPHSFSQLITSFFAFESLGILHTPFLSSLTPATFLLPKGSGLCSLLLNSIKSASLLLNRAFTCSYCFVCFLLCQRTLFNQKIYLSIYSADCLLQIPAVTCCTCLLINRLFILLIHCFTPSLTHSFTLLWRITESNR